MGTGRPIRRLLPRARTEKGCISTLEAMGSSHGKRRAEIWPGSGSSHSAPIPLGREPPQFYMGICWCLIGMVQKRQRFWDSRPRTELRSGKFLVQASEQPMPRLLSGKIRKGPNWLFRGCSPLGPTTPRTAPCSGRWTTSASFPVRHPLPARTARARGLAPQAT